ncbi:MAG: FkbM family methyltransferase [Alphaproteobacteria bacterium]|nr:FkbM family methyltransferase [Alphaproteobacteria bacterium]
MALKILRRLNTSLHRSFYKNLSRTRHKIVRFMGAEFVIRPDNYIDRRIWIEGGYERDQLSFMLARAREVPFDAFLDIGANFGLYTCILGRAGAVPVIHSFECDARNLYHLYGHIRMNGLMDVVRVHPFALGAENGELSFVPAPEDNTGRSHAGEEPGAVKVMQKRLDDVLDFKGCRLLIKIDVEGHEVSVLEGMEQSLRSNKCLIQVEILEDKKDVSEHLSDFGYKKIHRIGRDFYFTNMDTKT